MKERHVILRAVGPSGASRGGMLSGPTAGPRDTGSGKVSVEIEDIDTGAAKSLRKKQEILAVAPVMPMKLIAPRASKAQAATTVDWGVTAVGAVTSPFSGDGITVAVLDTGIDPTHDAFKDVTLVRKNFTDDASDDDTHGHGTHCAGTIFGRDVESTRIGVARGVKKALIGKVIGEDGGPTDRLVMAINWAVDEGANVISMSLGMDFPGFQLQLQQQLGLPPELATSRALEGYRQNVLLFESLAAVVRTRAAVKQPTIIIAAVGNESRTDENPDFKIAVSPPAVSEGIISVAALGLSGTKFVVAPFSNTGALVSGPGVDITSAKPGGGLTVMSGTSMATPHVAGVAALWAQKLQMIGPLKTPLFVTRLTDSGTLANLEAGFDPGDVGSGMVQAPQS